MIFKKRVKKGVATSAPPEAAPPAGAPLEAGKPKKKKKKVKIGDIIFYFFFAIIMLGGIGLLAYPTVSDWWNGLVSSRAIAGYQAAVEDLTGPQRQAILEAAQEYNARLAQSGTKFYLTDEEYEEYLNVLDFTGTGIMGTINIPSIKVSLPIYHTADEAVLQVAVGHIPGTSLPVGGESSHCVLSGHRGLPSARLFTDLDQMVEGSIFTLTVLAQTFTYEVDQIRVVLPVEVDNLAIEEGKDYCTLVTCTPYGVNSHRMLVRGRRIDNITDIVIEPEASRVPTYLVIPAVGIPALFLLLVIMLIYYARQKPRRPYAEILEEFKHLPEPLEEEAEEDETPNGKV